MTLTLTIVLGPRAILNSIGSEANPRQYGGFTISANCAYSFIFPTLYGCFVI